MRRTHGFKLAVTATAWLAMPVFAHHSTAMFEWGEESRITGVIKDFQWTNPHSWIVLEVKNEAGETEEWNFEGMSPNYLGRNGWTKRTLEPGDEITMGYYRLKDGRKGGFTVDVEFPDGRVMRELPSRQE